MTETKKQQRQQLYGRWHAAYMEASPEVCEQLVGEEKVSRMAKIRLLGEDEAAGMVGTINREIMETGNLTFVQGRLPEAENEILLEASAADRLGLDDPVGKSIELTIHRPLIVEDLVSSWEQQMPDMETEGEYPSRFQRILNNTENRNGWKLTLKSRYCGWATTEQAKDVQFIETNGTLYEQEMEITRECQVVGIIQSYSAFWDIGTYSVPNVTYCATSNKLCENL